MSVAGELRAVEIRGNRIEYYDVGRGEVLLLIHGGRTDATDWQNVLTALARHYHLVIADGMVYPFDARDLWWLLDHLGVSRVGNGCQHQTAAIPRLNRVNRQGNSPAADKSVSGKGVITSKSWLAATGS